MNNRDLLSTDFNKLEESIQSRLIIEILHKMRLIPDDIYFTKYSENAEALDRDYKIWKELKDT